MVLGMEYGGVVGDLPGAFRLEGARTEPEVGRKARNIRAGKLGVRRSIEHQGPADPHPVRLHPNRRVTTCCHGPAEEPSLSTRCAVVAHAMLISTPGFFLGFRGKCKGLTGRKTPTHATHSSRCSNG